MGNRIYNIKRNTIGVYMITCKVTNKSYIGSSVDISSRLSTHFGRDAKKYKHRDFYKDILKYGRDMFVWCVLEECDKSELINRELYYYNKYKPSYNVIPPCECSFNNQIVRDLSIAGSVNNGYKLRKLYNDEKYRILFRDLKRNTFKPVRAVKDNFSLDFDSLSECARWINKTTDYKGKNKVSKIKAVCDGERKSAFGYKFIYIQSVTTMTKVSTKSIDTTLEAVGADNNAKR